MGLCALAFAGAFLATRARQISNVGGTVMSTQEPAVADSESNAAGERTDGTRTTPIGESVVALSSRTQPAADAAVSFAAEQRMTSLRNAVIGAASEDMYKRGASVAECVAARELGGLNKLRFRAHITVAAGTGRVHRWRFIEIVDGEALPASFATCAEEAFGGPYPLESSGLSDYEGELDIIYFLPAS